MNNFLIRYLLPMFVTTLSTMTPAFRQSIIIALEGLQKRAHETPNPIDDIVVTMLLGLMNVPEMTQ